MCANSIGPLGTPSSPFCASTDITPSSSNTALVSRLLLTFPVPAPESRCLQGALLPLTGECCLRTQSAKWGLLPLGSHEQTELGSCYFVITILLLQNSRNSSSSSLPDLSHRVVRTWVLTPGLGYTGLLQNCSALPLPGSCRPGFC